jgi:S-DNA-T family DNA segregation ATPase FtsK/SpoIIIE
LINHPNDWILDIMNEQDDLFETAKQLAAFHQRVSASMLQRELKVGYARAARLIDMLEESQIIERAEGAKPRKVLIPKIKDNPVIHPPKWLIDGELATPTLEDDEAAVRDNIVKLGFRLTNNILINNADVAMLPANEYLRYYSAGLKQLGARPSDQLEYERSKDPDWDYQTLDVIDSESMPVDHGDIKSKALTIKNTLADFGYEVQMDSVNIGPRVSQYCVQFPKGTKFSAITSLDRNISLALDVDHVRIVAPIPGTKLIGIEVPNESPIDVSLADVLASKEMQEDSSNLLLPLGRTVDGSVATLNLAKAPHLLIAGATGSGKSTAIHAFIVSLILRNAPSELRLILIDPKRVEFGVYYDIPHLLTPNIVEPEKGLSAIKWAVAEMDRRFKTISDHKKRDIAEFNALGDSDSMPYIVIIVDEFSDLMVMDGRQAEATLQRISQMGRAVGIHLILSTSRPSEDVIPAVIRVNMPAKIAFTTASKTDSRMILDMPGAESLLGKGDMLFSIPSNARPTRIQGAYISEEDIVATADSVRSQGSPEYNDEVVG